MLKYQLIYFFFNILSNTYKYTFYLAFLYDLKLSLAWLLWFKVTNNSFDFIFKNVLLKFNIEYI